MRYIVLMLFAVFALTIASQPHQAQAAAGELDSSFAGTGMIRLGFGGGYDDFRAMASQADGKIIVAGTADQSVVLARFDTNDVLDVAFGENGVVFTTLLYVQIAGLRLQSDGKIVIAGTSNGDFLLARFHPDGSPDTDFGGSGVVTRDYGGGEECNALIIQSDGKVLMAGVSRTGSFNSYMIISRFDSNGVPDTTFNGTGYIRPSVSSLASSLVQQPDGKIVVGGYIGSTSGVFRFNLDGSPDTGFGSNGGVAVPAGFSVRALALQLGDVAIFRPDFIIVAGTGFVGTQSAIFLARLTVGGGTFDTNFNGSGVATFPVGEGFDVNGVSVIYLGRFNRQFVVSGSLRSGGYDAFMLVRFNLNGSPDTTFGSGGLVTTSVSPGHDQARSLVLLPGLLLLGGTGRVGEYDTDFALARYNWFDGSLDTNFHGTGVLLQNIGDLAASAKGVAVQADGKIVVVGSCGVDVRLAACLCRLNSDGTIDRSFGLNGVVKTTVTDGGVDPRAVVLQPDGKIVIAGRAYDGVHDSVMVARYLSGGDPDNSFGSNGMVITVTGTNGSSAAALALQPDGKIVVGGEIRVTDTEFAVFRYHSNGALDNTWNGNGKVITGVGPQNDQLAAVAIQSDGKIIAAGASAFPPGVRFSMVRYNTNGTLDLSFGSFGRIATAIGSGTVDYAVGMTLQKNGKIVLGGLSGSAAFTEVDVALVRYNTNSTLDTTFDSDGKMTIPIGLGYDAAARVAIQKDGKIVAACGTQIGSRFKFAALRLLTNGTPDSAYGFNGVNYFDFGTADNESVNDMALDAKERMVLVGEVADKFAILRVQGDPQLRFNSIARLQSGQIIVRGEGVPNRTHTLLKSSTLQSGSFSALGPVLADAFGNWEYQDSSGTAVLPGFYQLSYP